ncbi:MAG TPA: hypothetical protein VFF06_08015 [Polyangia bacterium]|nr:hypothetical protein [Polyangia bacterium]
MSSILFASIPPEFRRVLVVVEEPSLLMLLAEALADAGHALAIADDPAGLRLAIEQGAFDVVVVDLETRRRDAARLASAIREVDPGTKVVVLLPSTGLPANAKPLRFHLAVERPARLTAVLTAVALARVVSQN